MEREGGIRRMGQALIGAGLLWAIAIVIEYTYSLKPPNHGALYAVDQGMFFVAEIGYVVGIFGLMRARAVGRRWFAWLALGLFALGWLTLLVAAPLAWITRDNNLPLFPVGGLTAMLGGLFSGIAVAAAGRWTGWRRFSVLFYAVYYLLALLLPLFILRQGPTLVTESIWGLAWLPMGVALATSGEATRSSVEVSAPVA